MIYPGRDRLTLTPSPCNIIHIPTLPFPALVPDLTVTLIQVIKYHDFQDTVTMIEEPTSTDAKPSFDTAWHQMTEYIVHADWDSAWKYKKKHAQIM